MKLTSHHTSHVIQEQKLSNFNKNGNLRKLILQIKVSFLNTGKTRANILNLIYNIFSMIY